VLGPNSASRTNSNTFNVSVIDDPASWAALLAPVNPAILAFFVNQGYPRELMFFLFTDRLRQVETEQVVETKYDAATKRNVTTKHDVTKVKKEFRNDPTDEGAYGPFLATMANLLISGLTAEIDITSTPTGRALPPSKLCIDQGGKPPDFGGISLSQGLPPAPAPTNQALCENAPWISAKSAGAAGGGTSVGGGASGGLSSQAVTSGGTLWTTLGASNEIVRIAPDGSMKTFTLPKSSKQPADAGLIAFDFYDTLGRHFQLFTRSTYGAYKYLGEIRHYHADVMNLLKPDGSDYGGIINVLPSASACFAEITYRNKPYCVPQNAGHTKQIFGLLHQLQQLNTAPANAPAAITTIPIQ
jgi:hypothetical protein